MKKEYALYFPLAGILTITVRCLRLRLLFRVTNLSDYSSEPYSGEILDTIEAF